MPAPVATRNREADESAVAILMVHFQRTWDLDAARRVIQALEAAHVERESYSDIIFVALQALTECPADPADHLRKKARAAWEDARAESRRIMRARR